MTEARYSELNGQWVFYAEGRLARPFVEKAADCPFCLGNEGALPAVYFSDGGIRSVPNKYPANEGFHEVLIDTTDHSETIADMTVERVADVLRALTARYAFLSSREGVKSVAVFKNHGTRAGASISHSHWQLVGLPFITEQTARERRLLTENGGTFMREQMSDGELNIYTNGLAKAFCPAEPRFPYETWIATIDKTDDLTELTRSESALRAVAESLRVTLNALLRVCGSDLAYNIVIHNVGYFFIQILPRVSSSGVAGLELGSGVFINPVKPAVAAARLRA